MINSLTRHFANDARYTPSYIVKTTKHCTIDNVYKRIKRWHIDKWEIMVMWGGKLPRYRISGRAVKKHFIPKIT